MKDKIKKYGVIVFGIMISGLAGAQMLDLLAFMAPWNAAIMMPTCFAFGWTLAKYVEFYYSDKHKPSSIKAIRGICDLYDALKATYNLMENEADFTYDCTERGNYKIHVEHTAPKNPEKVIDFQKAKKNVGQRKSPRPL